MSLNRVVKEYIVPHSCPRNQFWGTSRMTKAALFAVVFGAQERIRTSDLRFTKALLYH